MRLQDKVFVTVYTVEGTGNVGKGTMENKGEAFIAAKNTLRTSSSGKIAQ
jgi:beta-N-acetylglucosaminidase